MKKLLCLLLVLATMLCGCMLRGELSTLSGDELVVALAFPTDDFSSMSPERQAAYTAACLELEVMNGGLCQFFANCPDCVPYVPEALEAIGAAEHKARYDRFLADTGIDPLDPVFRPRTWMPSPGSTSFGPGRISTTPTSPSPPFQSCWKPTSKAIPTPSK